MRAHGPGELQRLDETARARFARAGEGKSRAVVGRGANERKPEGHVDAFLEGKGLERWKRLIVIHANRGVVGGAGRIVEHRIGRVGAGGVEADSARLLDRGRDDVRLLSAHASLLSGMRIEA